MLQLNRTQSARAGKMGGMSKYTKGQYHLLVKYTKRAGRNFTASNSADAVSSAPGRFARDGSTGRYPDQETAMGCATLFRTHVENVLFAEDEHRAQNNVLKSGGGAVSTPSAPAAAVREKLPREAALALETVILKRLLLPTLHDHNTVLLSTVRYVLLWHSVRCSTAPEVRGGSNSLAKY